MERPAINEADPLPVRPASWGGALPAIHGARESVCSLHNLSAAVEAWSREACSRLWPIRCHGCSVCDRSASKADVSGSQGVTE